MESLATPTLSLSGIISDAQMSATTSDSIWTYAWTVSATTSAELEELQQ